MNFVKRYFGTNAGSTTQANNTNAVDPMDVYSNNAAVGGADSDIFVIIGDREATRLKTFARCIMDSFDSSLELRVTRTFPIGRTLANGIGLVQNLVVTFDKKYAQVGLIQNGTPRLLVNYFYSTSRDFERGTVQIAMGGSRALNLVGNIVRLLVKWTSLSQRLAHDRPLVVMVHGHGYLSPDAFKDEFAPFVRALQRRGVFNDSVRLHDVDRGVVTEIVASSGGGGASSRRRLRSKKAAGKGKQQRSRGA